MEGQQITSAFFLLPSAFSFTAPSGRRTCKRSIGDRSQARGPNYAPAVGLRLGLALELGVGEGDAEGEADTSGLGDCVDAFGEGAATAGVGDGDGEAFETISFLRFRICSRLQSGTRKTHFSNRFSFSSRCLRSAFRLSNSSSFFFLSSWLSFGSGVRTDGRSALTRT